MTDPAAGGGFARFAARRDYPLLIVTTAAGGERAGCVVGFASQCSIDPPLFMVWLSRENRTYRVAQAAELLAVHALDAGDRDLAELFGGETGDEVDKFARCDWREGPGGVPVLAGAGRWFVGRALDRLPTGDHVGHLLEPVAAEARGAEGAGRELTFQQARDIEAGHGV